MATDRDTVTLEDLVYGEMIQTDAPGTRRLVKKGILTKAEVLQEGREVSLAQHATRGGPGGES